MLLNTEVGVQYFYDSIFHGVVCIAGGNKMAWLYIGLEYNA
jgi:hypothetical protein